MACPTTSDIQAAVTARSTWENRQTTWYQMRHDGLRRRNKPWPNAADMHYALGDGIIEKLKPTYVSQVYATDTIATFTALSSDFTTYQAGAAQWLDYQLKQESNFEEEIDIAIDMHLERGRCPVKVYWDAEEKQVAFEAIDPIYIIVPPWTAHIRRADWIVHVQRYSKEAYKALPDCFKKDEDTIAKLFSGDDTSAQSANYETQRTLREGITKTANKDECILWEIFFRDENRKWCIKTTSPNVNDLELRPTFGLPYARGIFAKENPPPPFMEFRFETKQRGIYSPRGVMERIAPEEQSMCKDWNTMKDYQTLTLSPVFYAEQGVPNGANIRMIPGQILPFKLAAVQFPQIPVDLPQAMANTQRIAEERLSAPTIGAGRQVDTAQKKTAAEANLIASIMSQSSDVRSRAFRRQLGELLALTWAILVEYRRDSIDYYFNEELQKLDARAFDGRYRIEPSGSGDNNNRGIVLQKAVSRMQMFKGDPSINQQELTRSVLEADDPRIVKRLLLNQGTQQAEQIEDQAQELSIMLLGFPAEVRPSDDDAGHVQSIMGFMQRRVQLHEPLTPEQMAMIGQHTDQHLGALKKKNPAQFAQVNQQAAPFLAELKRQIQMAQQAKQAQQPAMMGGQP